MANQPASVSMLGVGYAGFQSTSVLLPLELAIHFQVTHVSAGSDLVFCFTMPESGTFCDISSPEVSVSGEPRTTEASVMATVTRSRVARPMPLGRIEARLLCGMHEVTTWKKKKLVWQSFFFPSSVKTSNGKPRFCLKR